MNRVLRITLIASFLAGSVTFLTARPWLRERWEKAVAAGHWLQADAPRNRKTAFFLIWIVALIPMIYVSYLVRHYAVEVPTLDDWEMAPLIVSAHSGHFNWSDIFAQQQEARTVLPKLIFILSSAAGHWDVRDQMMLSVISCWLTAAGVFVLLRRSGLGVAAIAICFWLAVLTIFTTAQFELWIFASGFPSFFPALFIVTGLVVVGSDRFNTTTKFVLCAALATASAFTLANGLLGWALTFPALLLMRRLPRWRFWLAAWLVACALCALVYFWGYQKPRDLPAFAPSISWLDYVRFILEFLGGGLAYSLKHQPDLAATLFGLAQVIVFVIALLFCVRRIRDRSFLARVLPWFALAAYSIGSAVLAGMGRVAYGPSYALASRYVTFSIYLTISLVALVGVMVCEHHKPAPATLSLRWSYGICAVLLLAYLIPYKACAFNTTFFLRGLSAKDRVARAAVLFCRAIDTSEVIKKTAYPNDARPVTQSADALDRLKLLRPPLVRTSRLEALPHETVDGKRASGSCESVTAGDAGQVRATGWAALDAKGRPPDCVAVAYQTAADQPWILCAISDSFSMRPEIVKRFGSMDQLWTGWSATFPQALVPAGARLSFWAVDADEPRLYRLQDQARSIAR